MNLKAPLSSLMCLFLFASASLAGNKQQEGEELVSEALSLSNIRANGSPAFLLKATFQSTANSSPVQGSYSETWLSRDRWRREIEIGSFHRVEVGGSKTRWQHDDTDSVPHATANLVSALEFAKVVRKWKVKSIAERNLAGHTARCVTLETDATEQIYCVDPQTKVVLLHETRFNVSNVPHYSFVYQQYEKLGDHLFPRSIRYLEAGHDPIDISVSQISLAEEAVDPTLLTPLPGAIEMSNCDIKDTTPPKPEWTPDPHFPEHEGKNSATPVLWTIIGTDGMPHNIKVARTGGSAFDDVAIKAVSTWRFKPATCDGTAVPAQINVEVDFRR
jgi:TonB family protein